LASGQTLSGNGVINGNLTANAGSTVSPGLSVGTLTVSNAVVLSGTNIMELDQDNGTNDVLRSNTSITYGGTLNLVNLGSPLTNNASFKLFSASSYLGSFSHITPATPGPGQTWDISALNVSGTIKVAGGNVPRFGTITLQGNNLVMSGSNGEPLSTYYVRASTNVDVPLSSWPRIATNAFDASGNFSFTTVITAGSPRRFFVIETP
jgi:hypothetical protein